MNGAQQKSQKSISLKVLFEHINKDLLLMRATIELKRVVAIQNTDEIMWPEDLQELLRSASINVVVGRAPGRKWSVNKEMVQMNLLGI